MRPRLVLAGIAIVILATSLAYLPSLRGPFVSDDHWYVTENVLIKASDGLYRFWFTTEPVDYYPVSNSTLWLEWRLWGNQPTGYRVTNLALHLAAVALLWVILRRLAIPGAYVAALLFALHPVNVESVAWIAQRKGLLALSFLLSSVLCYLESELRSSPQRRAARADLDRWYWLSLAGFVSAMLSKGSVGILPLLLLGLVAWLRPLTKWDVVRAAPFFLVSATLVPVNRWFHARLINVHAPETGLVERFLGAGAVVWFYLYKALVPLNLSFVYPKWEIDAAQLRWWLPLMAVVGCTWALWWYRRNGSRPLLFAWGYFCLALVPVMGFVDVGFMEHSLVADHYQHLALIGVAVVVAAAWATWRQRLEESVRWVANGTMAAVAGVLAVLTWHQSGLYASVVTLYEDALEKNPSSWMAHNNLSVQLLEEGRRRESKEHAEQALRLNPDFEDAHTNLGLALLEENRLEEAIGHFEHALRVKPDHAVAHNNLAAALLRQGRWEEAQQHARQALHIKPQFAFAYYNLGNALVLGRRPEEAIGHFRRALELAPEHGESRNNLASALFEIGRLPEAIEEYEKVLQLAPDFPNARLNLGRALLQEGRTQEAIVHLEEGVRLSPDSADAHNDLGVALAEAQRLPEAIEQFEKALQINPAHADASNNLQSVTQPTQ